MKKLILAMLPLMAACSDQPSDILNLIEMSQTTVETQYITFDEARKLAADAMSSFFENSETQSRSINFWSSQAKVSLLNNVYQSRSSIPDSTFYVINFENGGGVILAADKRVVSKIYGITPTGKFDTTLNPVQEEYFEWAYKDAKEAATDTTRGIMRALST